MTIRLPTIPISSYSGPHGLTLKSCTRQHCDCLQVLLLWVGSCRFVDENDTPNIVPPRKGNFPTKRGGKRKSPSRGASDVLLHLLQPPSPLVCKLMQSTTMNAFATFLISPWRSDVATVGGQAGEFPANIFETAKIIILSDNIFRANNIKKLADHGLTGGSAFNQDLFPPPPPLPLEQTISFP